MFPLDSFESDVRFSLWTQSPNVPDEADEGQVFHVTHPHHPLRGQQFRLLSREQAWGTDRVLYRNSEGLLASMPTTWTSAADEDPFVVVAAGRCLLRMEDILALIALLRGLEGGSNA
jgi:hypothetical protein